MDMHMEKGKKANEVLNELSNHIDWCLSKYTEDHSLENNCIENAGHKNRRSDWTNLRIFQNNLFGFLDRPGFEQATAIASLLIYIIDKTFSDLCTATPWDNQGVIDAAREEAHKALLDLLSAYRLALQYQNQMDENLWAGFRAFETTYNRILKNVNEQDKAIIDEQNQ